jgi:four helix bundle protein
MSCVGTVWDLDVYRRSVALADVLHRVVWRWSSFDRWTLGLQMVRAADSIGANLAEAAGRSTAADRRRLLIIARGSAVELQHWLSRARSRGLLLPDEAQARADELGRMLNGLIKSSSD